MGDPDFGGIQIRARGMYRLWEYPECRAIMGVYILGAWDRLWEYPDCHVGVSRLGEWTDCGDPDFGVSRLWEHYDCGGIHIIGEMDRLWGIQIMAI